MVRSTTYIYIEGGGDSREGKIRCRDAFRVLLEKCGFKGRMPALVASGPRNAAYQDFCEAHRRVTTQAYVAMLVDSEEPLNDIEATWDHLKGRDRWDRPSGASDDQALFMTTCMESWIVADRAALRGHFGVTLQESALPALDQLESRERHAVQDSLDRATRSCRNRYEKGKRSFEVLAKLDPATLAQHAPSFRHVRRILAEKLRP